MKKLFIAALAMMMCLAFAGCGGASGYSKGEQFQLGDETYALEKWERHSEKDTGSTECYAVCVLQVGNTAPVVISGFGTGGAMNTSSAIQLTLNDGDSTISPSSIGFAAIDDVEGYGCRLTFYYDLPAGSELPESGTLTKNGEEESAELNLGSLSVEEATTTTTTTTATTISPENLPVDPNYDPEANKNIGNTDVYDPIESFDVTLPDTDF